MKKGVEQYMHINVVKVLAARASGINNRTARNRFIEFANQFKRDPVGVIEKALGWKCDRGKVESRCKNIPF